MEESKVTKIFMLLLSGSAISSALLVGVVRGYALRAGVLDQPNARSSHTRPTPRGGGLGLITVLLLAGLGTRPSLIEPWRFDAALFAIGLVACVGWIDDRRGLPVVQRLLAHILAGALILPTASFLGVNSTTVRIAVAACWVIWVVSSINVVNFIDGIDGLIGAQAVVFGFHLIVIGQPGGAAEYGAVLAGASMGFLLWNWSPARIFLGDVGSGALGIAFVLGGFLAIHDSVSPVSAFLPLFSIFLDASVTLFGRWRRGERVTEAHRSHLYQRLANGGWGHRNVALLYAGAALLGVLASFLTERGDSSLPSVAFVLFCLATGIFLDHLVTRNLRAHQCDTFPRHTDEPLMTDRNN
jgi:Fuc2NAc and GlcNAc transferase